MPTVKESLRFIPLAHIPQIPETTPLVGVFESLSARRAGGFVAISADKQLRHFVRGNHLAEVVLARAAQKGWETVAKENLLNLAEGTSYPGFATVPIANSWIQANAEEISVSKELAIYLVKDGENDLGWFCSGDGVRDVIYLPSPVYKCDLNGHRNSSFDTGDCAFCPGKLI